MVKHGSEVRVRRGQGMTEYVVIVGLVALLLVSAVSLYGFRVSEAIQGSEQALRDYMREPPPDGTPEGYSEVHGTATKDGNQHTIYRVNENGQWQLRVDGTTVPYSSSAHGPITPND